MEKETVRIGINGLGEMGRQIFRAKKDLELQQQGIRINPFTDDIDVPNIEVVAVNDLASTENLVYLMRHHSVTGNYPGEVRARGDFLNIDGKMIKVFREKAPGDIDWNSVGVDLVYEVTGVKDIISTKKALEGHFNWGGNLVVVGNPSPGAEMTIVYGVNHQEYKGERIISAASCTTNCLAPLALALQKKYGINSAKFNTIHAYTASQKVLDGPHNNFERGLAAALNIIPTGTGASKAIGKVIPELEGKISGFSTRVPVGTGSLVDLTFCTPGIHSKEEINKTIREAADGNLKGILGYTNQKMSSGRVAACPVPSLVGLQDTEVVHTADDDGKAATLCTVLSWYDNQRGYTVQTMRLMEYVSR